MKEIDDTPLPENESGRPEWFEKWLIEFQMTLIRHLESTVRQLQKQVANLETQRTPQDENDDPEWY